MILRRIGALCAASVMAISVCMTSVVACAETLQGSGTGGLCPHHPQHTEACGYQEASQGAPCNHQHTDACYTYTANCVHTHTAECYPDGDMTAEPTACTHQCSEASGCITRTLNCQHQHDASCGYQPATEGSPCTYVCTQCNGGAEAESQPAESQDGQAVCAGLEGCTGDQHDPGCPLYTGTAQPEGDAAAPADTESQAEASAPVATSENAGSAAGPSVWQSVSTGETAANSAMLLVDQGEVAFTITASNWQSTNAIDSGQTVYFPRSGTSYQPTLSDVLERLNQTVHSVTLSYTYQYLDAEGVEQTVERTNVVLDSLQWNEQNADLSALQNLLDKDAFLSGTLTCKIPLQTDYLAGLLLQKELQENPGLTGKVATLQSDTVSLNCKFGNGNLTQVPTEEFLAQNTVQAVSPKNVILNLFDYWQVDEEFADGTISLPSAQLVAMGVNSQHALLFRNNNSIGTWNSWTNANGGPNQKIVDNVLNEDGYPQLALTNEPYKASGVWSTQPPQTYDPDESLQYLFDADFAENEGHLMTAANPDGNGNYAYGRAYKDVKGLFQINEDGNYYYSSHNNFAEFDAEKNAFNLYNTWAVKKGGTSPDGQFFPFNSAQLVFQQTNDGKLTQRNINSKNAGINHYLGLTMEVEFQQPLDGMVSVGENAKPMVFQFSGDDDVWIFIDDVLVADLGGIHDEASVDIDFSTGQVNTYLTAHTGMNRDTYTLKEAFEAAGRTDTDFDGETLAGNTRHTLKLFYLERGNTDSNLTLSFNLLEPSQSEVIKLDQNGEAVEGATFELYKAAVNDDGKPILEENGQYKVEGDSILSTDKATSDDQGRVILPDDYDYSQNSYYVLRETTAPEGYFGCGDILLRYDKFQSYNDGTSSGTNLLMVENRWTTGAVATFSADVYQSGALYYDNAQKTEITQEKGKKGLILAVPMIKDTNGFWQPLYGSNLAGFNTVSYEEDTANLNENQRRAILQAALYQIYGSENLSHELYREWYLEWSDDDGRYEGTLTDLPGDADRYYWASGSVNADMTVSYYFLDLDMLQNLFPQASQAGTSADKLGIIAEAIRGEMAGSDPTDVTAIQNAVQAVSDEITGQAEQAFGLLDISKFNRVFSSRIYVPNTQPELRVVKQDQDGNPLQGAEFTLYEDEACTIEASSGTTNANGVLLFSAAENGDGQAQIIFKAQKYYLKETQPPAGGYAAKEEVVPVYVTEDGRVYADALEANDGVTVLKGLGKLVQTMVKYAGNGSINATLRDITAERFTADSFEEIDRKIQANVPDEQGKELRLHYGLSNALLEYGTHEVDGVEPNPYFETDTGIAGILVHQDYTAHEDEALYDTISRKIDLQDTNIRALFTGSTTVVMTNRVGDNGIFSIKKTVSGSADADQTKQFAFAVSLFEPEESGSQDPDEEIDVLDPDKDYPYTVSDEAGVLEAGTLQFQKNDDDSWSIAAVTPPQGVSQSNYFQLVGTSYQVLLQDGQTIQVKEIPFQWKVEVTETPDSAAGYITQYQISNGEWNKDTKAAGTVLKPVGNPAFVFNNHKDKVTNLTVSKTVAEGGEQDKAFPFTITLRSGGQLLQGEYQWQVLDEDEKPVTGADGTPLAGTIEEGKLQVSLQHGQRVVIINLPVGTTYMVQETTMGYAPSVTVDGEPVQVVDGAVSGTLVESTGAAEVNVVAYTNTRSGSITITKRNGTGSLLNGAGFTLYDEDDNAVGAEIKTQLAMRTTIPDPENDEAFDAETMRYVANGTSYIVHTAADDQDNTVYFYYRFLTETEQQQYYDNRLPNSDNVEAIVQFDNLALNKKYSIEETTVPAGYMQNTDIQKELGEIMLPMTPEGSTDAVYDVLYTVVNHKKMVLPTTGLDGITLMLGLGGCLLVIAWSIRQLLCHPIPAHKGTGGKKRNP